jgi:hypothetical protein
VASLLAAREANGVSQKSLISDLELRVLSSLHKLREVFSTSYEAMWPLLSFRSFIERGHEWGGVSRKSLIL